jgi:hypothetical protein
MLADTTKRRHVLGAWKIITNFYKWIQRAENKRILTIREMNERSTSSITYFVPP